MELFNPDRSKNRFEKNNNQESMETHFMDVLLPSQLQYSSYVFEGKIPNLLNNNTKNRIKNEQVFKNIFLTCSGLEMYIYESYCRSTGTVVEVEDGAELFEYRQRDAKFARHEDIIMREVFSLYKELQQKGGTYYDFTNKVFEIIKNNSIEFPPSSLIYKTWVEKSKEKEKEKSIGKVGLVEYEVQQIPYVPPEFRRLGVMEGDMIALLHFDAPSDKGMIKEGKFKEAFSKRMIIKLIFNILIKYPKTKLAMAESWMLDTNFAKEVGFQPFAEYKPANLLNTGAFWGQFIDSQGKVKQDKINQFLQTGKPPHQVKAGYISVSYVKEKYLGVLGKLF